jgi:hypothetical protein
MSGGGGRGTDNAGTVYRFGQHSINPSLPFLPWYLNSIGGSEMESKRGHILQQTIRCGIVGAEICSPADSGEGEGQAHTHASVMRACVPVPSPSPITGCG